MPRKKMSQKASVKRLWWNVDLLWGLFMRNTARRLPSIPTLQMTGVKMSLSQRLTNSSLAESKHRQSPVWFMLQSLYTTESVSSATVCLCTRENIHPIYGWVLEQAVCLVKRWPADWGPGNEETEKWLSDKCEMWGWINCTEQCLEETPLNLS